MARFSLEVWINSRSSQSNVRGRFLRVLLRDLLRLRNRKINEAMKIVSSMPVSLGAGGDSGLL